MDMNDLSAAARDAAFVAVGLGLIGFQRAQVRRRELEQRIDELEAGLPPQARDIVKSARQAAHDVQSQLRGLLPLG
jgi:hypothetical protein